MTKRQRRRTKARRLAQECRAAKAEVLRLTAQVRRLRDFSADNPSAVLAALANSPALLRDATEHMAGLLAHRLRELLPDKHGVDVVNLQIAEQYRLRVEQVSDQRIRTIHVDTGPVSFKMAAPL